MFPSTADREVSVRLPVSGVSALIGAAAVGFSILYLISDLVELAQGGFSTAQLFLTYVAEAAIPLFVLGLYAMQRPAIGRLGLLGAIGYAYAYVFFTSTVVYALLQDTPDWSALTDQMGTWLTVHSLLIVAAGLAFGLAVVRAGVFPAWTGALLMAGIGVLGHRVVSPGRRPDRGGCGAGLRLRRNGRVAALLCPRCGHGARKARPREEREPVTIDRRRARRAPFLSEHQPRT